jgi:hypothetical protein
MPDYEWTCSACQKPNQAGKSVCASCGAEAAQSALSVFTQTTGRPAWQYFVSPEGLSDALRMLRIAIWWIMGAFVFYLSLGYESILLRALGTCILLVATWYWFKGVIQAFQKVWFK